MFAALYAHFKSPFSLFVKCQNRLVTDSLSFRVLPNKSRRSLFDWTRTFNRILRFRLWGPDRGSRTPLFSIFHCYRDETKVNAVAQKGRKMSLMALARRQIAPRGRMHRLKCSLPPQIIRRIRVKKSRLYYISHHFVSLSTRSTALEMNCHDKSAHVDFSREARRFQDDGLGFLALITVIRKLEREDWEISPFSTISGRYKKILLFLPLSW